MAGALLEARSIVWTTSQNHPSCWMNFWGLAVGHSMSFHVSHRLTFESGTVQMFVGVCFRVLDSKTTEVSICFHILFWLEDTGRGLTQALQHIAEYPRAKHRRLVANPRLQRYFTFWLDVLRCSALFRCGSHLFPLHHLMGGYMMWPPGTQNWLLIFVKSWQVSDFV